MLVYVSGKYSADPDSTDDADSQVLENIKLAGRVAGELWDKGHAVLCPHTNTNHFLVPVKNTTWEDYMRGDYMMIARCDAVVMLPNWETSRGARAELAYAEGLKIPIYYYPQLPELHPTEVLSPVQCKRFAETLGQMYRTHLSKNHDYSPANILGMGEVGGVVRLWDKAIRLANLNGIQLHLNDVYFSNQSDEFKPLIWSLLVNTLSLVNKLGFRFKITKIMVGKTKSAKNESIDDTLIDLSVYAIIQRLLMAGEWGR